MSPLPVTELSPEQRHEVASWIALNLESLPEPVRVFLALHGKYLEANGDGDLQRRFDTAVRELRRALGITPSSERRRSGSPLSSLPPERARAAQTEQDRLEQQLDRSVRLSGWHGELKKRHRRQGKRLKKRLAKLKAVATTDHEQPRLTSNPDITHDAPMEEIELTPVEEIELTPEELAESQASALRFGEHLLLGDGADPALQPVHETLRRKPQRSA